MTNKEMIRAAFERDTTDEILLKEGDTFTVRDLYVSIKAMYGVLIPPEEILAELITYNDIELLFKRKRG